MACHAKLGREEERFSFHIVSTSVEQEDFSSMPFSGAATLRSCRTYHLKFKNVKIKILNLDGWLSGTLVLKLASLVRGKGTLKLDLWALSAVVARFVHIEEVRGSIPLVPTVVVVLWTTKKDEKEGEKERWIR